MIVRSRVFVDSNIIIYAFTSIHERRNEVARQVFHELLRADRICLSTQVLQEVFVNLTKKHGVPVEAAIRNVEDLGLLPLFVTDKGAIVDAARLSVEDKISFWDAMILVAAIRLGAEKVLTEDLNHGQVIRGMRIVNPFRGEAV